MELLNKILSKSNSYNYYKTNFQKFKKENKQLKNEIEELNNNISQEKILKEKEINKLNKQHHNEINNLNQQYAEEINNLYGTFYSLKKDLSNIYVADSRINNEIHYAFIFNDTIKNSIWLEKTDFSLVNSAANYSFMYSLYRILNDATPKNILELGLGQTTKLTSQYAKYFDDVKLTVFETDEDWIQTFSQKLDLTGNVEIINLSEESFDCYGTTSIRFKDISNAVGDEKYDLIIIDGPRGFINGPDGDILLEYSRTDIWQLIPSNLANDFIIIMDDYHRVGEKNTMDHVEKLLKENNKELFSYTCHGFKTQCAVFTKKYKFISWI